MEATGRDPDTGVTASSSPLDRLLAAPYLFDFFQAVRVLNRPAAGATDPGATERSDQVRFRAHVGLGFPASPLVDVAIAPAPADGAPCYEAAVTFLGLTGPSGVLPPHYTEALLRLRPEPGGRGRSALQDWLDVFNHRLTALFYQAWAKYRPDVAHEQDGTTIPPQEGEYASAYLSLIGLGTTALRARVQPPTGLTAPPPGDAPASDLSLIFYSGLLARQPRTAAGLEAVITGYLGVPVRVTEFVGRWLSLSESSQLCLNREGGNAVLGRTAMVGRRTWDTGAVKIRVGPLTGAQFAALLPNDYQKSDGLFARFVRLVRFYIGAEHDFSVLVVPTASEVPVTRIGSAERASRLGRNSWLRAVPSSSDPEDACFDEHLA